MQKVTRVQCNGHPFYFSAATHHWPRNWKCSFCKLDISFLDCLLSSWNSDIGGIDVLDIPASWLISLSVWFLFLLSVSPVSVCFCVWNYDIGRIEELRWISGPPRQLINFPECLIPASCVCVATIGGIEVSRGIRGSFPATNCLGQPQESFGQCCKFITFCNCYNCVVCQLSRGVTLLQAYCRTCFSISMRLAFMVIWIHLICQISFYET